jgi:hypothetical protein
VFIVPISLGIGVLVSEVVVIARGDLTVAVLLMAAVIFMVAAGRIVRLVSRPVDREVP